MLFCFYLQALFVIRYLNIYTDLFGHVGKRLDKKDNVIYNIHIVQ